MKNNPIFVAVLTSKGEYEAVYGLYPSKEKADHAITKDGGVYHGYDALEKEHIYRFNPIGRTLYLSECAITKA